MPTDAAWEALGAQALQVLRDGEEWDYSDKENSISLTLVRVSPLNWSCSRVCVCVYTMLACFADLVLNQGTGNAGRAKGASTKACSHSQQLWLNTTAQVLLPAQSLRLVVPLLANAPVPVCRRYSGATC